MRCRRQFIILSAASTLMATTAFASTDAEDNPHFIVSAAAAASPVEDVLNDLRKNENYSFVYDRRLLDGKMIAPIGTARKPEKVLKKYLADVGLTLHKTGRKSFAIAPALVTANTNATIKPAPAANFADVILVTASASVANSHAPNNSGLLFEISENYLQYAGGRSAADILHDLPLENSDLIPANTIVYGALAGINYLDFRGLGSARNTVLLNGQPAIATPGGNGRTLGVDLERFPVALLSRIEVDSDSGSARYGAAAYAGAVNFVLRSDFQGIETGAEIGVSQRGDDLNTSLHFVAGRDVMHGGGNVTAGVSISNRDEVLGRERSFSNTKYGFISDGNGGFDFLPGYGNSPVTPVGFIPGAVIDGTYTPLPDGQWLIPSPDGSLMPFTGALDQRYNTFKKTQISPSLERAFGFVSFSGDIGPDIELFADIYGGVVATGNQLDSVPAEHTGGFGDRRFGDALSIPIDHTSVSAALAQSLTDLYGETPDSIVLSRRLVEAGPRRDDLNRYYADFRLGIKKGDLKAGFVSLGYRYGRTSVNFTQHNRVDFDKLKLTLDESACPLTPGCVAADFFDPNGLAEGVIDFATIPTQTSTQDLREHVISVSAGKSFAGLLDDDIIGNIGAEYKNTTFGSTRMSPADAKPIGLPRRNDQTGGLETLDLTASLDLPLLGDASEIGALDVALDHRFTVSSTFDAISNFEAAANWHPIDGVKFYFHYLDGHRPPNIAELFSKEEVWGFTGSDPCAVDLSNASQTLAENCLSDGPLGIGDNFENLGWMVEAANFGNPELQAEDTESFAYGATAIPSDYIDWFPGVMELSATWRIFRLGNIITADNNPLNACFNSVDFSNPSCGLNALTGEPIIQRDPASGQLTSVDRVLINSDWMQSWRGLDVELRYAYEPFSTGLIDRLWLNAIHTYTHDVKFSAPGKPTRHMEGLSAYPRHVTIISTGAERAGFGIEIHAKRRGSVVEDRSGHPAVAAPAITTLGATFRMQPSETVMIKLNVENITDRDPPIFANWSPVSNTLPGYYDVIGRRATLSTTFKF